MCRLAVVEPLFNACPTYAPTIDGQRVEWLATAVASRALQVAPGGPVVGVVATVELAASTARRDVWAAIIVRTHVRILVPRSGWHVSQ
jgi:hypothetical protein